ncbi:MAG: DUF5685 family protein [Clostridiales bacterium]|nr:DUF5685 family protein [Clostridiales bacterium]
MFGYIICNQKGLSEEEMARYKAFYCGLCRSLKKEFGQLERFTLNFDMTFLVLFLAALYEPEEEKSDFRCVCHPFHKRQQLKTVFSDYAADMTIALSYFKCKDNWEDDHKYTSRVYGELLKKSYDTVRERYPRQCSAIEESLSALSRLEKQPEAMVDEAVNLSGRMLMEVFVYKEDFWSESLRHFGYELGRFIYLMDAAIDYEDDKKTGNYNPILKMESTPEKIEPMLDMIIGNAAAIFEQLPIVQDEHLIRNILYGGVWQKYNAKIHGKEKSHG